MLRDRDRFAQDDKAIVILRAVSSPEGSRFYAPQRKGNTYPSPPGMLPPLHSGCCATAIASLIRDDKQGQHQILRRSAPQDDNQ
jgi:hypothetical protein